MHPFAELGPIDPTVSNEFNPEDPRTGQKKGISVEDVTSYVNFIKSTVGITHEDELVRAIEILAQQVHPIALGNVERFISQSRMIARKILRTHMPQSDAHTIEEIVENMASKLYFHGHPINRREAKDELKLKVNLELGAELEDAMWSLYKDFEADFQNRDLFNPAGELAAAAGGAPPAPGPVAIPGAMPGGIVGGPGAHLPPAPIEHVLLHAVIESERLSSRYTTRHRYSQAQILTPQGLQTGIQDDLLEAGWTDLMAPAAPAVAQP